MVPGLTVAFDNNTDDERRINHRSVQIESVCTVNHWHLPVRNASLAFGALGVGWLVIARAALLRSRNGAARHFRAVVLVFGWLRCLGLAVLCVDAAHSSV